MKLPEEFLEGFADFFASHGVPASASSDAKTWVLMGWFRDRIDELDREQEQLQERLNFLRGRRGRGRPCVETSINIRRALVFNAIRIAGARKNGRSSVPGVRENLGLLKRLSRGKWDVTQGLFEASDETLEKSISKGLRELREWEAKTSD